MKNIRKVELLIRCCVSDIGTSEEFTMFPSDLKSAINVIMNIHYTYSFKIVRIYLCIIFDILNEVTTFKKSRNLCCQIGKAFKIYYAVVK